MIIMILFILFTSIALAILIGRAIDKRCTTESSTTESGSHEDALDDLIDEMDPSVTESAKDVNRTYYHLYNTVSISEKAKLIASSHGLAYVPDKNGYLDPRTKEVISVYRLCNSWVPSTRKRPRTSSMRFYKE